MGMNPADLIPDDTSPDDQRQQAPPADRLKVLESQLSEARTENAKARIKNRDLTKLISQITGGEVADGQPAPDLDTLKQRIEGRNAEVKSLKLDLGLERAARKHGVERTAVLKALLTDAGSLASFDPSSPTAGDDLDALVEETVFNAPELKGRPSSGHANSASLRTLPPADAPKQLTREQLAGMQPEEVVAARRSGLLDQLLRRGW